MKILHKIALLLILPGIVVTSSCKKTFFTDVNNNPNTLTTVPPALLLPTVEAALAYTQGGDMSRFSSLFMQTVYGANSQSQQYYLYNTSPGSFDNLWPDLYTATMENNHTLIALCDSNGYNVYGGIARIIMAYTIQLSVDMWGDMPYSTAFQGNLAGGNLHPTYDKAQGLYDTVASLINIGTAQLQSSSTGVYTPSTDDVIYGGNAAAWILFGHAIKARLAIHQSKNSASMATTALSEIAQSFTKESQSATYVFGTTQNAANTWYQFYRDRPGDENFVQSTLSTNMLADNDPRYLAFDLDSSDANGNALSYYNQINSPVEFITYEELLFMEAEATLRSSGNVTAAQTYLQEAITANMTKLGVASGDITTYLATHGILSTTVSTAISQVASEEFIALFLNPEAWALWRRTGSPALTTTSPGSPIPRRLLYPQTEYNYNAANVPANVTLWSPTLFWDN